MKFVAYSLSFKILLVAFVCVSTYEIGVRIEGESGYSLAILLMWFNHIGSSIPTPVFGEGYLLYALMNGFFFFGSISCLFIIPRFVRDGMFTRNDWMSFVVVSLLTIFSLLTISHYLDMFVNQERTYFKRDNIFATGKSAWAWNAYDNIISIAILLQIAQASINTGLKRFSKRQLSTGVSPTIGSSSD
jgi:hypothetical protein